MKRSIAEHFYIFFHSLKTGRNEHRKIRCIDYVKTNIASFFHSSPLECRRFFHRIWNEGKFKTSSRKKNCVCLLEILSFFHPLLLCLSVEGKLRLSIFSPLFLLLFVIKLSKSTPVKIFLNILFSFTQCLLFIRCTENDENVENVCVCVCVCM